MGRASAGVARRAAAVARGVLGIIWGAPVAFGCVATPPMVPPTGDERGSEGPGTVDGPTTTDAARSDAPATADGADEPESDPPAEPDPIGLSILRTSSTEIVIGWEPKEDATKTTVQVGPEPAPDRGAPLPLQRPVATLDSTADRYRLEHLAPAVDVFVRVQITTPRGKEASHVHARTRGGPRAELDGPVREVHGFAPHVLRITVTGGDGHAWQGGPWSVRRRDGTAIEVEAVHRHSRPVGAPAYETGWGGDYDNSVVTVDHRLHLVLAEPIGSPELVEIEGPNDVRFTLPFSDRYLETPIVQLNQVGYHPQATERWAYVSGWMGDGRGLDVTSLPDTAELLAEPRRSWRPRAAVAKGLAIEPRSEHDPHAGTAVRQIDLASVPADDDARYRVRIPGVGVSWPTSVSRYAALKAFYVVSRGLFHNRWGGDLAPEHTDWTRPPDHPTVYTADGSDFTAFYAESTSRRGERPLRGGYHDAGDFDQRPMHTVVPQLLMRAFEVNGDAFLDGQLTIPESGNGIPDLLDEALWGVEAWRQLQEDDGGVRMGVESHRHPWGFYLAHEDPLPYWTYGVNENVTARAAGLFAQAARLLDPYDAARADALREDARDAWQYARTHGAKPAYRLYAAGELYRLTREERYATAFRAAWEGMGSAGAFSDMARDHLYMGDYTKDLEPAASARGMPDYVLGYLDSGDADELRSFAEDRLTSMAHSVIGDLQDAHAHRNPRPEGYPIGWGNEVTSAKYMDPIVALLSLGGLSDARRRRYFDALSLAADFVLGCNPRGFVYITGLGTRRVREPLHLDSLVFIKEGLGPVPGIPVYGPTESIDQPWARDALETFHPDVDGYPSARKYGDVRMFVKTNEFTVWESQAPLAQLFALLTPGRMPPDRWLPGGPEHRSPLP